MSYLWRILTAMRMTIKEFFSFKTNKYFWVNIIAMIVVMVVMIFGVLKWLDIHTHHGKRGSSRCEGNDSVRSYEDVPESRFGICDF